MQVQSRISDKRPRSLRMALVFFISTLIFISFSCKSGLMAVEGECSGGGISERIRRNIPIDDFKIVNTRQLGAVCEVMVETDGRLLPFYLIEDSVLSGELWKNRVNMTSRWMKNHSKKNFLKNIDKINSLASFTYTPQKISSKRVLYLFTEPLCPYCHEAGKYVYELSKKHGFAVKIIFYSVHGKEGQEKCVEAVCRNINSGGKFNLKEYNEDGWRSKPISSKNNCKKGRDLVKKTDEFGEKFGIEGVPLIYNDLGNSVEGLDKEGIKKLVLEE